MVAVGRIAGLYGSQGELTLALYDDFPREPNMENPVFVRLDGHRIPLFFGAFKRRGQRGATAVFDDIDSESRAAELIGLEFYIKADAETYDDTDELFFEDMVGWEIELRVANGEPCGKSGDDVKGQIVNYIDSDLNPLFEVGLAGAAPGRTELIPAAEEFIVELDERRRKIVFELPEGLLGLNA